VAIGHALAAYTTGVADQAGDADICVLEADITDMAGRDITDVGVRSTWVGGRCVHRA
jgi:predicted amidohydrolase YtcJ